MRSFHVTQVGPDAEPHRLREHVVVLTAAREHNTTQHNTTQHNTTQHNTLADLEAQGYKILAAQPHSFINGEVHHTLLTMRQGQKKPIRVGLMPDGTLLSQTKLKEAYAKDSWTRYGSFTPHAISHYEHQPHQPGPYAVWFHRDRPEAQQLAQLAKELDPEAIVRQSGPPIIFLRASAQQLMDSGLAKSLAAAEIYPLSQPQSYSCKNTALSNPNSSAWGAAKWSGTENTFNQRGHFAEGIKIGIVEMPSSEQGIWEGHVAFAHNDVVYQSAPKSCVSDADCGSLQDVLCRADKTQNLKCSRVHTSQVASRISYTHNGQPRHAGRASLYIANGGDLRASLNRPYDWPQAFNILVERYEWLITLHGVKIINESWGMTSLHRSNPAGGEHVFATFHDSLNTWYTYHKDVTFIRAAGNASAHDETDCHALNSICVGSLSADCTYGKDYLDDFIGITTTWRNPHNHYTVNPFQQLWGGVEDPLISGRKAGPMIEPDTQIERPDLVAEGGERGSGSTVLNMCTNIMSNDPSDQSNDQYTKSVYETCERTAREADVIGTSFAAPVITGLVALCEEVYLASRNALPSHRVRKTHLKQTARERHNLHKPKNAALNAPTPPNVIYPTYVIDDFSQGVATREYIRDYKAGVGIVTANSYYNICQSGPNEGEEDDSGEIEIDLENGDEFPSSLVTTPPNGGGTNQTQPDGVTTIQQGLRPNPTISSGYKLSEVFAYGQVAQGERIRATITYDSCPKTGLALGPTSVRPLDYYDQSVSLVLGGPSVDVDLALCDLSMDECETYSESFADTSEGFDIITTKSYGDLRLYAIWPEGQRNCFNRTDLPFAWASYRKSP